jgi:thiamine biosynthesis protein ThiI
MRCQSRLGFIAVMKFIVKLFPEIIIKSKPVRKQFTRQLHSNLYSILKVVDPTAKVERSWDRFVVESSSTDQVVKMVQIEWITNNP